jgi:predicted DNA-binding ribbon-helix-helix protein
MRRDSLRHGAHNGFKTRLADSQESTLRSGNVTVGGRRTSIRLEPAMWQALREISVREGKTMHALVTEIERGRAQSSLTAAIRVFLLDYFRAAATEEGHRRAGHRLAAQLPV